MILFLEIMLAVFIAEMGDKTQLMLIALTSKYKLRDIILGTALAIMALNAVAVLAGGLIGTLIPPWVIKLLAAGAFIFFALTSLKYEGDEEEEHKTTAIAFAPAAVFVTFFLAELGDKTQLAAITFGANEGLSKAFIVWLACSLGLFGADMVGMLIGYMLKSKIPEWGIKFLAFVLFAVFGVIALRQGIDMIPGIREGISSAVTVIMVGLFIAYVIIISIHNRDRKNGV